MLIDIPARDICRRFLMGASVTELAQFHCLKSDTVEMAIRDGFSCVVTYNATLYEPFSELETAGADLPKES